MFEGRYNSILEPFWFIETLLHCLLLVWLLSAVPGVRRWTRRAPLGFGAGLLALASALRLGGPAIYDHTDLAGRPFDQLFLLIALGWCADFARGRGGAAAAIFAATLAIAALNGGLVELPGWIVSDRVYRLSWLVGGMALLLFVPQLPIPGFARPALMLVAAASFSIYVVHGLPIWMVDKYLGGDWELLKIAAGVAAGFAFHLFVRVAARALRPAARASTEPAVA